MSIHMCRCVLYNHAHRNETTCVSCEDHVWLFLWPHGLHPSRLLCPWISQAEVLERVVISSCRGSSWPRDWTCVSCGSHIAGGFFTIEPLMFKILMLLLLLLFCSMMPASTTNLWAAHISTESREMWAMAWSTVNTRFYLLQTVYFIGQQHHHA